MNLNTVAEVKRPTSADQITQWRDGYAWLAGGTWLFSEPQVSTDTLIDLQQLNWPALQSSSAGLDIAATCTVAELYRFAGPSDWHALPLVRECCNAFLASFKIWNAATVGGNICMSLPAGPMISLTVALEATYTLWPRTRARTRGPLDRFRDRKSHQRSPTGRTAPQHSLAGIGAIEALRVSSRVAHASRTLGGAVDRHAKRRRRRSPDHDHRGDASADPAAIQAAAIRDGAAAHDRRAHPCRRILRRRPRLGRLQAPAHPLFR